MFRSSWNDALQCYPCNSFPRNTLPELKSG